MVLGLYRDAAPKTVEHFEGLVRGGLYDGLRFYRIDQGFLIQTSIAEDREAPLTADQLNLLRPVPFEHNDLRHARGMISLAHDAGDRNGGVSSFAIALGDAEQLDGEYTIFARVEDGFDVLDEIASVPVNASHAPLIRVNIEHAEIAPSLEAAQKLRWPRRSLFSAVVAASDKGIRKEVAALVSAMLFCTVSLAALGQFARDRWLKVARMVVLLLGGFGLVLALLPLGQRFPYVGGAAFVALLALFRAMNHFEPSTSTVAADAGSNRHPTNGVG
jgi:cyclophilin family peptidyl-prolyl cis-trans isomerase